MTAPSRPSRRDPAESTTAEPEVPVPSGALAGPPVTPPPDLPRSAWIGVDLDALVANLQGIRDGLPSGTGVLAVVKADAYGHGAVPVARALRAAGVAGLCVATFDEALELRRGGVRGPIVVLYPIPPALAPEAARRGIAIVAGDAPLLERTLSAMAGAAALAGTPSPSGPGRRRPTRPRRLGLHLEIETGLGRGGVLPDDAVRAAATIAASPHARLAGVWTHLSAPADRDLTARQVGRFEVAGQWLEKASIRVRPRHLASSGAVLVADAPAYDAIRAGLALYGLVPDGLTPEDRLLPSVRRLQPVLSLRARPVRVAEVPAGWGISYGPSFVTLRPSRIATLPLGYADGFPRSLSNNADALVRGRRVPLVGTVAMDAIMIDVTDVPGPPVSIDDEFVLIGRQGDEEIDVAELARRRTSISWEVVAALPRRLPRVYYAAAGAIGIRTLTEERGSWRASNSGTGTSAISRSTRS